MTLRRLHLQMVEAVLVGDGLGRVAELAAHAAGAPVAIVVPRRGVAVGSPDHLVRPRLAELRRYAGERHLAPPAGLAAQAPIATGDDVLGLVGLFDAGGAGVSVEASAFLRLAAMASLTEVAVREGDHEHEHELRHRARRLGCDLSRGAAVVCAPGDRDGVAAAVADVDGALVLRLGRRVVALLPGASEATAGVVAARLTGAGVSAPCRDESGLERALQEAELRLEAGPEGLKALHERTIAPLARHDELYGGELVATLAAFLGQGADERATATTLGTHRHTVVYRLDRVAELSGLDPRSGPERERLALGLRANHVVSLR